MSIIMRGSGQKRDSGDKRKQLYTWSGCGLVIILTLVAVVPHMGSEPQPDYSKFSSSRMQDLAALPFGTDAEASDFLRGNPEYKDVSNADLLGSLFSAEDRKARQVKDKEAGTPPPPDPEYKAIFDEKQKVEKARQVMQERVEKKEKAKTQYAKDKAAQQAKADKKRQSRQAQNQTRPATLAGGSRVGGSGGGGSATVGSIWRYEGKDLKSNQGMPASHATTAKDLAFARDKGRGVGLDTAAIESAKGANAEDAETAAAGAIDAFQKEVSAEDLEKDKEELGLEELPEGVDPDLQDDINRAINDDLNNNDNDNDDNNNNNNNDDGYNDNCMNKKGKVSTECLKAKLKSEFLSALISNAFSCLTSGCWNNWAKKKDGAIGSGDYFLDNKGNLYYKGQLCNGQNNCGG